MRVRKLSAIIISLVGVRFDASDGHVTTLSEKITLTAECMCIHDQVEVLAIHYRNAHYHWNSTAIFTRISLCCRCHKYQKYELNGKERGRNDPILSQWVSQKLCIFCRLRDSLQNMYVSKKLLRKMLYLKKILLNILAVLLLMNFNEFS